MDKVTRTETTYIKSVYYIRKGNRFEQVNIAEFKNLMHQLGYLIGEHRRVRVVP
jgi:hypothetical protein